MEGRVFENFQKNRKFLKIAKNARNRSQKCPNVCWTCFEAIFPKKFFCSVFHGGSSCRKFSKKSKTFQNCKKAQNRSQKCPNVFWTCFGVIFSKIFFAQCSMEGRVFENFQKNQKFSKFPKKRLFWVNFLEKFFLPSLPWKSFPKVSKRVLNMFWGNFFESFVAQCLWRVESSKSFFAHNRSQKSPNVFWICFENFQKKIFSKKNFPKRVQTCFEYVLGRFFRKNFLFHGGSSLRKFSKRSKTIQNCKNAQNLSQKCPNVIWTCFGLIFSKKIFCPVFHGGSSLRKFSKKSKLFKNCKNARNRSQNGPNVFWTSFGAIFPKKFFCSLILGGSSCRKFSKKSKTFQNCKKT